MVDVWQYSLAFSLFAITNESLDLEMWSVGTEVDHKQTYMSSMKCSL